MTEVEPRAPHQVAASTSTRPEWVTRSSRQPPGVWPRRDGMGSWPRGEGRQAPCPMGQRCVREGMRDGRGRPLVTGRDWGDAAARADRAGA
jgi:hypothetical protein